MLSGLYQLVAEGYGAILPCSVAVTKWSKEVSVQHSRSEEGGCEKLRAYFECFCVDFVFRSRAGISSEYQKAGSMLAACQSMMAVIMEGSSSETKMFLLCRSG